MSERRDNRLLGSLFLILSVSLSLIIRIFLYVSTSSTAYFLYFFIDNVGWVGMVG